MPTVTTQMKMMKTMKMAGAKTALARIEAVLAVGAARTGVTLKHNDSVPSRLRASSARRARRPIHSQVAVAHHRHNRHLGG